MIEKVIGLMISYFEKDRKMIKMEGFIKKPQSGHAIRAIRGLEKR